MLKVGAPNDAYEREADAVADRVMRMAGDADTVTPTSSGLQRKCATCENESEKPLLQPQAEPSSVAAPTTAPASVDAVLHSPGQALDSETRAFFEPRFGQDFGGVQVHSDSAAQQSARDVSAHAYTVGHDIVFGTGRFAPQTREGQRLLAHELTHVVQQSGAEGVRVGPRDEKRGLFPVVGIVQRYTAAERREMAEGRVTARQSDIDLANQRGFQPGDIVFRRGSTTLGFLTGEPVTHGGIYLGDGLIHDVVGFGNRHVRVGDFYNPDLGEAADRTTFRVVRFRGPLRDLIITRLLLNIRSRDFAMPTDPVPFNLFSSAGDYRTATCLEYAHAQFLRAIQLLVADPTTSDTERTQLRSTYFAPGTSAPRDLIRPTEQRLTGRQGIRHRTPSVRTQEALLMAGADALATDVDPTRFRNRSEAEYSEIFLIRDELLLRTFTYSSFVDSRQFFQDATPP